MINSITSLYKKIKNNYLTKTQPIQYDMNKNPEPHSSREYINNVGEEVVEYEIVEKEILPEKMICPDCGGITLVGLEFCDKCGGELINPDLL
jgi:hypothetical protein